MHRFLNLTSAFLIISAIVLSPMSSAPVEAAPLNAPNSQDDCKNGPCPEPVSDPFNDRLAVQVGADGRFNMGAFPDPETGGAIAGSWDLTFSWPAGPWTSFTTFRIDGSDYIYGSSGTQLEAPHDIDPLTNQSKWQIGDLEITQTLQIVLNNQTNLEDVARIAYTIENLGTMPHDIGTRIMIDTEINYNDGAPYRVPGVGIVRTESEYLGSEVPDYFQAFFGVTDSEHVAASTIKTGGEIVPDRVILAHWEHLYNTNYDYTIDPSFDFTDSSVDRPDSAYAVYWNPSTLAPGDSRTNVTYYGLAQLNVDLQPPLALGITGPATLSVVNNQYSPNPFDIVATVFNNGTATATDVQLTITLPGGLSLAAGSATQSIGDLEVGQERQVSWSVLAAPQDNEVTLTYSVTAVASNTTSKTVSRDIILQGLNVTTCEPNDLHPYQWNMTAIHLVGALNQFPNCQVDPIKIAIIDTGVEVGHPDLEGRIFSTFTTLGKKTIDQNGHGTFIAGIVAANQNNGLGIAGIHPNADLMIYKYTNKSDNIYDLFSKNQLNISNLIKKAVNEGARVINLSLGFKTDLFVIKDAVEYAANHNPPVIIVAGAWESYPVTDGVIYPANYALTYDNVIAVTSSTVSDAFPDIYADPGDYITIAAPGGLAIGDCLPTIHDCVFSLWPLEGKNKRLGGYNEGMGTSYATPHVTGVVALMLSANPDLTPHQIKTILINTSTAFSGQADNLGFGIVNASRAVECARNPDTTICTGNP